MTPALPIIVPVISGWIRSRYLKDRIPSIT